MKPHEFYWKVSDRCGDSCYFQSGDVEMMYERKGVWGDYFSRAILYYGDDHFEVRYDTKHEPNWYWWHTGEPSRLELVKLKLAL